MQRIRSHKARGRSGHARLGALSVGAVLACLALSGLESQRGRPFALGAAAGASRRRLQLRAEGAAAPAAGGQSVALVKVTEESKVTTAGVLGGLAGLLLGGIWVGGAVFAATSYLAKKEDSEVSQALKGIATGGLEVLNFGAMINDKYTVTDRLGSAISGAIEGAASSSDSKGAVSSVSDVFSGMSGAVKSLDDDIGIKDTIGTLATSATDLAFQAVDKAVELNKEYKVTDQIVEKIQEATSSTSKAK